MEAKHLFPGGLQPFRHYHAHPLEQLVAKRVVLLAVLAQNGVVKKERGRGFDRASGEMPDVRWEDPGPAEQIARADCFQQHRIVDRRVRFEHHPATLDEVKAIREIAFAQNRLAWFELCRHRAIGQESQMCSVHSREEGMERDTRRQWF